MPEHFAASLIEDSELPVTHIGIENDPIAFLIIGNYLNHMPDCDKIGVTLEKFHLLMQL
jgi:hypothetical protein